MRILFLSHYALPHIGGIEVVIDQLGHELAQRGHEVVQVASAAVRESEVGGAQPDTNIRVVRVPALNTAEERLGVPWPLFSPRLLPVLRREVAAADVVHAHGLLYMSSLAGLLMARAGRRGQARIVTEHVGHVDYDSRAVDAVERVALGTVGRAAGLAAHAAIALNAKVEAELRALLPKRPVHVIPNGVDVERYRPPAADERRALRAELGWDERPRVLFVGRLVAKKGVHLALEAAARGEGAFELVVVGPGRLESAPPAHVDVRGALPLADVARLYRAADAFVLPSRGEGFPVTVQEAMASGLPVLMREDPIYVPYVEGAGDAARMAPPDGGAIAAALRELVTDPPRLAAAQAAAREHAVAAFSWQRAADAHEELYRRHRTTG